KAIAEADAAADLSFAYPHVCVVNGFLFATFQQIEAGDVAASRVMFTSVNSDGQVLSTWREPFPAPYMENATYDPVLYGAPLAYDTTYDQLYLLAPGVLITANRGDGTQEFSELVTACSWRETPTGCKATLTLDFSAGFTYTPDLLRVGNDLLIQHGMVSSTDDPPEAEYGTTLLLNISRIVSRIEPGKTTLTVEADGPWEQLARFRAPQAWTAPAGQTRGDIFQRVAGRAGLIVTLASGDRAPSDAWTTDTPEFAIAAGESAAQTLRRLLEPTDDFLRLSASGGFEICGIAATDGAETDGAFIFPMSDAYVDNYSHILSFERFDERRPNWHRAVGPDRYADTFLHELGSPVQDEPWTSDPVLAITRDLSADDDSKATAAAERGFHRRFAVQPRAQLVTPLQSAIELYDVIFVGVNAALPDETTPWTSLNGPYRVIGRGVDFRRGPASGAPVYNSVLDLGFAAVPD
ncbi:MAG: hypothetical protein IT300_18260, partial [Dehalococcoidia bacterium]|nr:hypothetical protein [Dehalococcoidia bacterium]